MSEIQQAIEIIKKGGIVIFPTDTAFGIGCRIDDKKAVKKLFQIRKRPPSRATPVLVENIEMAQKYLRPIPQEVIRELINPYWPGALTIVLPCQKEKVPTLVRGGSDNLGVRVPNNQATLALIRGAGVAILGPSANFHGLPTPFRFQDLDKDLVKLVDFVINGESDLRKPARYASLAALGVAGRASTVIDCSQPAWKILRKGAIGLNIDEL